MRRTIAILVIAILVVVALFFCRKQIAGSALLMRSADVGIPAPGGASSNSDNHDSIRSDGKEQPTEEIAKAPESGHLEQETSSFNVHRVSYKVVPSTNVDARIKAESIMLPIHSPSNLMGQALLQRLVTLVSNDLDRVNRILQDGRFEIREWNMSKKSIVDDEESSTSWHLYFDGPSQSLSGLKKVVFRNGSRTEELRSQGYDCSFSEKGDFIKRLSRNDGSEYLLFSSNGQLREYAHRYDDMSWYSIRWGENGAVISEKVENPSLLMIAAQKKLVEEWKNDPNKIDAVRQLQEELNRMQSNR